MFEKEIPTQIKFNVQMFQIFKLKLGFEKKISTQIKYNVQMFQVKFKYNQQVLFASHVQLQFKMAEVTFDI